MDQVPLLRIKGDDIEFGLVAAMQRGRARTLTLDMLTLDGEDVASVIAEANALYQKVDAVSRPEGFRIREDGGSVVYECIEVDDA
jgi:hypothetical protein